jgi:regulator of RNase E activity RraA
MIDLINAFASLPTTCISDALNGLSNMNTSIKPLKEHDKVCGRAHTVSALANDNLAVLKGIRTAKPGDVLVVDAKGYDYNCVAGDFVIGMAKALGLAGLVADGTIRDIVGIKALDFPVFCKGTTVAAGGKAGVGSVNIPISCGGVTVKPGDIIVGDADGVVVIPLEQAESILILAQEKERKDQERSERVLYDADSVRRHLDIVLGQ